jgi:uridine phosphorylase
VRLAHNFGSRISTAEVIPKNIRNFPGLPYIFFSEKNPVNVLLISAWYVHGTKQVTINNMQAARPIHLLYFIFKNVKTYKGFKLYRSVLRGPDRIRTDVEAFAELCLATRPRDLIPVPPTADKAHIEGGKNSIIFLLYFFQYYMLNSLRHFNANVLFGVGRNTMQRIAESELIINERGAIYHLSAKPEEISNIIITVGDPDRVGEVTKHFDKIEHKIRHREFVTHTGYLGKKRISVLSTGIGTDNIDIVLNELDALVNIDFDTRTIKEKLSQLDIIRIGTSGAVQQDVPVDSYVASTHGLGVDNLMNFYVTGNNEEEKQLLHTFVTQTQLHNQFSHPYITGAGMQLLTHFVEGFHQGITVTCPGFYGPQGRVLRLGVTNPQLIDRLTDFKFGQHRITNFEMETAGLYGLGKALNHHCLSLSLIVTNRIHKEFSKNVNAAIEKLIVKTLDIISSKL